MSIRNLINHSTDGIYGDGVDGSVTISASFQSSYTGMTFGSTTVNVDSNSGQKTLSVASSVNFSSGDSITINRGGVREETVTIDYVKSASQVILTANLTNTHTAAQADAVENKSYALTRAVYYQDLTINSGQVLLPTQFTLCVNGILGGAGTIRDNGNRGGDATGSATFGVGGSLVAVTKDYSSGVSGGRGSESVTGTTPLASTASFTETLTGGKGGTGGTGDNFDERVGAAATTNLGFRNRVLPLQVLHSGRISIAGGPGGSGGGWGSSAATGYGGAGGGGGSGGGCFVIYARQITGTITCEVKGGNGGTGGDGDNNPAELTGGGGGGGGASGGYIQIVTDTLTNPWTVTKTAGTGGSGGSGKNGGANGNSGDNGVAGVLNYIYRPTPTFTIT